MRVVSLIAVSLVSLSMVLGMVALRQGNMERARQRLLEAGKTHGSATSRDDDVIAETNGPDASRPGGAPPGVATPADNRPEGCYLESASFAAIPSGDVPATLTGKTLAANFSIIGEFVPRTPCLCACGEYRQYVKGAFTANGKPVTHSLGPGRNLNPTTMQQDGDAGLGTAYGYHSVKSSRSIFVQPEQKNGCRFEGNDQPGITSGSGKTVAMDLEYLGVLIDTCQGNKELASSAWTVSGSAKIP